MCSNQESCLCEPTQATENVQFNRRSTCVKCKGEKGPPALIIRSDDPALCRECFLDSCMHKFKSSFGKTNIPPRQASVAVAFSGGLASSVLVDLIHKINLSITQLRDAINSSEDCTTAVLKNNPNLDKWARQMLLVQCARQLNCEYLIVADSGSRLACNFFVGIIEGRGSHGGTNAAFCDKRYKDVTLLRPLHEFMSKELVFYAKYAGLNPLSPRDPVARAVLERPSLTSLPRLCEDFLSGLQVNGFPSTTQTVMRYVYERGVVAKNVPFHGRSIKMANVVV